MNSDESPWKAATWDGLRRLQRREFRALPLRKKLEIVEAMGEVAEHFAKKRRERIARRRGGSATR